MTSESVPTPADTALSAEELRLAVQRFGDFYDEAVGLPEPSPEYSRWERDAAVALGRLIPIANAAIDLIDAERRASAERIAVLTDLFDRATMPGDDSTPLYDYLAADARAIVDAARDALGSSAKAVSGAERCQHKVFGNRIADGTECPHCEQVVGAVSGEGPEPPLRTPSPDKVLCGWCGDWLRLQDIEGHLNSEGRTLAATPPSSDADPPGTTITLCNRADCRWQVTGMHYPHGLTDFDEPIYAATAPWASSDAGSPIDVERLMAAIRSTRVTIVSVKTGDDPIVHYSFDREREEAEAIAAEYARLAADEGPVAPEEGRG